MVRLPDIGLSEFLADQQEQFQRSTSGMFDALEFDLGARELAAQIPTDYPLPGGPDQWQQAEEQRIKDDLDRAMREEEERRRQQAALEEQQRQEQERQRAEQATRWASSLGIPTPDQIGEQLHGIFNRPADNIGTSGALTQMSAPLEGSSSADAQPPLSPADDFLNWSGSMLGSIGQSVGNAAQKADEAYREFQQTPLGMTGGMPAAMAGVSEIANAFVDPLARDIARSTGRVSQEGGSSGIDVDVPFYGRFAPSQEDVAAGIATTILDPMNLMEAGPITRAVGETAGVAARVAREFGEPAARAFGRLAREMGEEAAWQIISGGQFPRMIQSEGSNIGRRVVRGAEGAAEGAAEEALPQIEGTLPSAVFNQADEGALSAEEIARIKADPYALTDEERALNAAADARAREQPPHAGYLEEPEPGSLSSELERPSPIPNNAAARGIDRLYHETSPREAFGLTNTIGSNNFVGKWVSPDPDLALGQGANRGARIELGNTEQLEAGVMRRKPGAQMMEAAGEGAPEYIIHSSPQTNDQYIKSITVAPDATWDRVARSQAANLERRGWTVETLPDGSRRYVAPEVGARARQMGAEVVEEARRPPPEGPPPPDAAPAPPKGSAPKTVGTGDPEAPKPKAPPPAHAEEVQLPDGRTGRISQIMRQGRRESENDIVTILTDDGSSVRARVGDLERHGAATTASSPHPGFSTGELPPLPEGRSGGGGTSGKPPAPPAPGIPTPPPPPQRPRVGPGSAARESLEKTAAMHADVRSGKVKPGPPDNVQAKKILTWFDSVRTALTDKRARLETLQRHLEKTLGRPLTLAEKAHTLARVFEGHRGVAEERIKRVLAPTLSQMSNDEIREMDNVMGQLAIANQAEGVRHNVQQEALGKKLPVGKPGVDAVRREGEAVLESQRAQRRLKAAEKEVVAAEKQRTALLKDLEALGYDTERRPPQQPGVRRAKRETQRLETPEIEKAHDAWTKADIRYQTAIARRDDARARLEHEAQWRQERIDARRAIHAETRAEEVMSRRKYPGGATPQPVQDIMDDLVDRVGKGSADRIRAGIDSMYALRDEMREAAVDAGLWSREMADDLFKRYPYYSPMAVLKHMEDLDESIASGKSFSTYGNLVHRLTEEGTETHTLPPSEAMLNAVFRMEESIEKNRVMRAVHGWTDVPEMSPFVRKLKGSQAVPPGFEAMSVRVDGRPERIAVYKELKETLELNNAAVTGMAGRILRGLAAPLQAGATALRPGFVITNAVNDAIMTLFRFTVESPNPVEAMRSVTDLLRGYRTAMGETGVGSRAITGALMGGGAEAMREAPDAYRDENGGFSPARIAGAAALGAVGLGAVGSRRGIPILGSTVADRAALQQMREAGGVIGNVSRWAGNARTTPELIRSLQGQHVFVRDIRSRGGLVDYLKEGGAAQWGDALGLMWSRPLGEIGGVIESAPRIAAYNRAIRQGKTAAEAANAARRVTADFSAGGVWTKQVNQLVPFLNASTQAAVEGVDIARKNPVKFAAALAATVPLIVATEIWNRTIDPEGYQDVSQYTKDRGLVMLSPEEPEGQGKRGLLFVPLRGITGSLVPLVKNVMGAYFGDDPRTWQRLAKDTAVSTFDQISPVSADGTQFLRGLTPPLLGTAMEAQANYDSFRGQPIVSRSMETLPVSEQYDDRTSQLARHISRSAPAMLFGGTSPMKIDWFLRSVSPGPGEAIMGAADAVIHATGQDLPSITRDVPRGARDVPLVGAVGGRFLRTVGSERQNRAYELADEIAARNRPDMVAYLERSPDYQQATPDRQRQMLRSMEAALLEQARDQAGVSDYDQGKNLGLPPRFEGVKPGSRLEQEIVTARNTNDWERTPRQWDLYLKYIVENPLYGMAAREQTQQMQGLRKSYLAQEMENERLGRR